jgi:hypothetical protein
MSLRAAMPDTAAIVDELRAWLGSELVDQAIANGRRLQRQFEALAAEQGEPRARLWLDQQRPAGPVFAALEAGLQVGVMPGRCGPISPRGRHARSALGSLSGGEPWVKGATSGVGPSTGPGSRVIRTSIGV